LINWEGAAILVDIGPGTVTKLVEKGLSTSSLQGILVSHSHIDHFWDLVPLLWLRYLRNQRKRLKIICPRSDVPLMEWCTKVSQTDHPVEICGLEAAGKPASENSLSNPSPPAMRHPSSLWASP